MDHANYYPTALPLLRDTTFFAGERFSLIDVGCAGGIDAIWRTFGEHLEGHCFDPQQDECRRLAAHETNPNIHFHAAHIGLDAAHPYQALKRGVPGTAHYYHFDWSRSSAGYAQQLQSSVAVQSNSVNVNLCGDRISLAQFVHDNDITNIDFIKTDTDGHDFEVLLSCDEIIRPCGVLGFQVECNFTGSAHQAENSFHNIDRFMRERGFSLYALSTNRYSRRHLPAPFTYRLLAQTVSGQVIWGDALYLRDGASPHYQAVWGDELPLAKVVKLAMLYELCALPDCAAELILKEEKRFRQVIEVRRGLDALTPRVAGRRIGYWEYLSMFEQQIESFLPAGQAERNPAPASSLFRRLIGKCARKLRRLAGY